MRYAITAVATAAYLLLAVCAFVSNERAFIRSCGQPMVGNSAVALIWPIEVIALGVIITFTGDAGIFDSAARGKCE